MYFHTALIAGAAELISREFFIVCVCNYWWLNPPQGQIYADLIAESAGLISAG